ncbi:beta-1,3-glucanase family protein [Castellaniella sp.]|uniref:beta-1,3-glucanase family protein n=1 Tax=Castellaniella sp. TaxID=1955812 RepID=UPI002AFEF820|nr:beta-1,3-glucanase family protein [Castellaniella sp.]
MPTIDRRRFLSTAGASVVLVACGGCDSGGGTGNQGDPDMRVVDPEAPTLGTGTPGTCSQSAVGMDFPLCIDLTQSDLPTNTPIYAYIVGLVQVDADHQYQYWLDPKDGLPKKMAVTDNQQKARTFPDSDQLSTADQAIIANNYPMDWADFSIPLSMGCQNYIDLGTISPNNIPGLGTGISAFSGRIYFSIGVPRLPFVVLENSNPNAAEPITYSAPSVSGYPGMATLFDWIEFSYDTDRLFYGNTTQVDQYGFSLILDGAPGGATQGKQLFSRAEIFNKVKTLPSNFSHFIKVQAPSAFPAALSDKDGFVMLRALSPVIYTDLEQALQEGTINDYFDAEVLTWYKRWETQPLLTYEPSSGYYCGRVESGVLTFYQGETPTGTPAFKITSANGPDGRISSHDIWACAGGLASGDSNAKNTQKSIAAAFQRGVMSYTLNTDTCVNEASRFYQAAPYNPWAKLFHEISDNGLSYAFPYDDLCDQSTTMVLRSAQNVTITLPRFFS